MLIETGSGSGLAKELGPKNIEIKICLRDGHCRSNKRMAVGGILQMVIKRLMSWICVMKSIQKLPLLVVLLSPCYCDPGSAISKEKRKLLVVWMVNA